MDWTGDPARLRLHGELNDLLKHRRPADDGAFRLARRTSIKDALEALGAPHTEIGEILANGERVGFSHIPGPAERIDVYPIQRPFTPLAPGVLRPTPLPCLRFLADENVFALGMLLRAMNHDVIQAREVCPGRSARGEQDFQDDCIARFVEEKGYFLLTKDRNLLKRKGVQFGRLVRSVFPDDQCAEIMAFLGLSKPAGELERCLRCNTILQIVEKNAILDGLEPKTRRYYEAFKMCRDCGRIYWKGSHYEALRERLDAISSKASRLA